MIKRATVDLKKPMIEKVDTLDTHDIVAVALHQDRVHPFSNLEGVFDGLHHTQVT